LVNVQMTTGKVVKEVEGFRSLDDKIVDRHRYQVDTLYGPCKFLNTDSLAWVLTDGSMHSSFNGNVQLCSNPISSTDQHGILIPSCFQIEDPTEASDLGVRPRSLCTANEWLDPLHEGVPCIN